MASSKSLEQRNSAEAKKADRERDAVSAMREYHAEKARIDANTERLRALRLAKEAASAQPTAAKPAAGKKTTVRSPARRASRPRSGS